MPAAVADIIPVGDITIVTIAPPPPLPSQSNLLVGESGTGSIEVNGGSVLDGSTGLGAFNQVTLGANPGATGSVLVTGAGSRLVADSLPPTVPGIRIGESGSGTLEVRSGGNVSGNRVDTGGTAGAMGVIIVDGAGSSVTSGSTFIIGGGGTGRGTISGGGTVTAQTSNLGSVDGGDGQLAITGSGSRLDLVTGTAPAFGRAFLNVGREQRGELKIVAGGKVLIDAASLGGGSGTGLSVGGAGGSPSPGGSFANGNGIISIDGVDSELRIRGATPVSTIGRQGTALVNITGGGKFITENLEVGSNAFVGRNSGGSGTVNVTGAGSEWQAGRRLFIGADQSGGLPVAGGTGTVHVASGGLLSVAGSNSFIAVGAGGTLTGGGGTIAGNVRNDGVIRPGNSTGVMTLAGNLVLNPAGAVELELGGTSVALMQYDQLNAYDNAATTAVEGTVTLGGTLRVLLSGGFEPLAGSFFDVFTALDIVEGAAGYELPALGSGLSWQYEVVPVDSGREALRLTVLSGSTAPEPGSLALLVLGAAALAFSSRRRA
ncbi:MAG: PEP-CTERM sorting domain-containing protein [Burkholderiales bacterium]|nr:PEP-CTERM sorting domain-containing protein [Burkholderiales bacterium]